MVSFDDKEVYKMTLIINQKMKLVSVKNGICLLTN